MIKQNQKKPYLSKPPLLESAGGRIFSQVELVTRDKVYKNERVKYADAEKSSIKPAELLPVDWALTRFCMATVISQLCLETFMTAQKLKQSHWDIYHNKGGSRHECDDTSFPNGIDTCSEKYEYNMGIWVAVGARARY